MEKDFVKFLDNNSNILVDAPHSQPPEREFYTDEIAEKVATENGFNCIVSKISRTEADLNRSINYNLPYQQEARTEYIEVIKKLYENRKHKDKPYLHLTVHGMRDGYGADIEIGTVFDRVCSPQVRKQFVKAFRESLISEGLNPIIKVNNRYRFYGHPSLSELKIDDNYNIIQIEFSKNLRQTYRGEIINALTKTLKLI
ncbi:MAG: hypothetical protein Q9M89_09600 [Persephonella sp.]|nr:hypothetical protein [Persephonella sp.]